MSNILEYVDGLQKQGRYHFTTEEISSALSRDGAAVLLPLHRLKRKGRIASPQKGFHVIVPPEYRALGCLPAEQFVPQLMEHVNEPYYVTLLSAAQLHGAAHHRPQRFQVMVKTSRRPILCGRVAVEFHVRGNLEDATVVVMNTPRGHLRVASPETTALDLIGYQRNAGGLDNVGTILADLAEVISGPELIDQARTVPVAWVQRLGFLLELVERNDVSDQLQPLIVNRAQRVVPLDPALPITRTPRSLRWKIAINVDVEPDL